VQNKFVLAAPLGAAFALLSGALVAQTATQPPTTQPPTTQPASLVYVYLRGVDTLGVETITVTPTAMTGDLVLSGANRFVWSHARRGAELGELTVKSFAQGAAANSAPVMQGSFRIQGDSAFVEVSSGTRSQRQAIATSRGAVALMNASVLHAALLGSRAARMNVSTLTIVPSSGGQSTEASVARRGDTLVVVIAGTEMRVLSDADGMPREITVPKQSARIVRVAASEVAAKVAPLLNYDAPAGAPYTAEQVRIPTGRGYELAGTLTRPVMNRTVPVVVTISGSGPQERDSRIPIVPGYAPFREIADTLARRGIATLRYDDRGIGASGGIESARNATSADFADDVRSVIAWLRTRSDIDASKIALVGHSEGGMIAPMVAATSTDVRAIALLAGNAYSGRRVMMGQNRDALDAAPSLSAAQRDSIWKSIPARLDTLATTNKWIGFFMSHDPIATAKRVKQPVLILQGNTDHQVTPEQADTLGAAFRAGGNRAVTIKHFPNTNHLFLNDPSGLFQGYAALKNTRVRPEVLGTLADWLATTLR
jgi:dipeptidyl aminopeptidase/acylaminoacyl peptidase